VVPRLGFSVFQEQREVLAVSWLAFSSSPSRRHLQGVLLQRFHSRPTRRSQLTEPPRVANSHYSYNDGNLDMCRQHAELIELREEMSDLNYAVGILELWRQQAKRMAADCLPEAIRFTEAETRARIASIERPDSGALGRGTRWGRP
jgi:hypothetical protein